MHGMTKKYIGITHPVRFFRYFLLFFLTIFLCNFFSVSAHAAITLLSPGLDIQDTGITIPVDSTSVNTFDFPEAGTEGVTVFRWTDSGNANVESYVVQLSTTGLFAGEEVNLPPVTRTQGELLTMTGVDIRPTSSTPIANDAWFAWRVIARNSNGDQIDQSDPPLFVAYYNLDQRGFSVLSGVVQSDLNQAALAGATVTITSTVNNNTTNSSTTIGSDRNFILVAETTNNNRDKITTDITLQGAQAGFNPASLALDPTSDLSTITLFLTAQKNGNGAGVNGDGARVNVPSLIELLLLK